jgi:hypothetical protein
MIQFTQYYGRFQGMRGQLTGLPSWARTLVFLAALPGLVLLALSVLAFVVSLFALLLLTVPVYSVLRRVLGSGRPVPGVSDEPLGIGRRSKAIDSTVVD